MASLLNGIIDGGPLAKNSGPHRSRDLACQEIEGGARAWACPLPRESRNCRVTSCQTTRSEGRVGTAITAFGVSSEAPAWVTQHSAQAPSWAWWPV
jgi:hypothetical protein